MWVAALRNLSCVEFGSREIRDGARGAATG
jgi:hypothetical protein